MSDPIDQHLISKGYQKNFARADMKVSVFDTVAGVEVGRPKAIKSNFTEEHFNTLRLEDGDDFSLEQEYSVIETQILDSIRKLKPSTTDSRLLAAAIALCAMHLVRSNAYRDFHNELVERVGIEHAEQIEQRNEVHDAFIAQYGRTPSPGELAAMSRRTLLQRVETNDLFVSGSRHAFNSITDILRKLHLQVIDIHSDIKHGFAFGDVPVVHAHLGTRRFGFRDRLAVGDADLIMTPLTRRSAVAFTARPRGPGHLRTVQTHAVLRAINTLTLDASLSAVACHPDDLDEIRRTWRYRDSHRTHPSIWPTR